MRVRAEVQLTASRLKWRADMDRPTPPLNVLIIEDEALLVMDMQCVIEDFGHRVVADVASVKALQALHLAEDPHIALVDVQLADKSSGLEASEIVRRRWADASIIFVTANPGKVPEGHAGAYGIIAKPFTDHGLTASLRYLTQGICTPPPQAMQPASFTAFPAFRDSWAI